MSHGFRFAIAFIAWQEDPREDARAVDLGDGAGLTKYGITQKNHPEVDVVTLTWPGAVEIYEREYWEGSHSGLLAIPLGVILCDGAVNHGVPKAVTLFQRAVGVPEDGVVGPVTAAAARNVGRVMRRYCYYRAARYAEHPRFRDSAAGPGFGAHWIERLVECYAYALGLPD